MKKILMIGLHSYIGQAFQKYMQAYAEQYQIDVVSSRNHAWENISFGDYDCVLHLAGIAHVNAKADMEAAYYEINRDLTIACCQKAKAEGAKQFLFLSSIIVYGQGKKLEKKYIHLQTKPNPDGFYGDSKLQAERGILEKQTDAFTVTIVRPPMVYGNSSKGNYPKLAKLACRLPFFPAYQNERSMIYIENLCECIRLLIEEKKAGIFHPQNRETVQVERLVQTIAKVHGKTVKTIPGFSWAIRLCSHVTPLCNKVFGTLVYDRSLSDFLDGAYQIIDFEESIRRTETEEEV